MRVLIVLSVLVATTLAESGELTAENICKLVQEGHFIKDPESCNFYYQCVNGKSIQKACAEGNVFDKEKQICVVSNHCDPTAQLKCEDKVNGFVSDDLSCNGFYHCLDKVVQGRGECPGGQIFDKVLLGGSCVWENEKNKCTSGKNLSICDLIKSGEFFGSFDECKEWNKCINGEVISGICDNGNMVLNLMDGTCTYTSDCRQTGGHINSVQQKPPPSTIKCKWGSPTFISDNSTCAGYYWCDPNSETGFWGKCANNQFFNGTLCVDRTSIVCDLDRCQGMGPGVTWVNIKGDGCRGYNFCKDGRLMVGEKPQKCIAGYFDEKVQRCVAQNVNYPACTTETILP